MADLLLLNANIYTLNPTRPRANAILFVNGRVAALDDDARAIKSARAETIDLRGRTVIPGLIDAHVHFTGYAMGLARVQLDGARSLEEAVSRVAARVKTTKPGEWVLGMGWNHMDWVAPLFPTKAPLDAVAPNNPVLLDRKDGHSIWVNSAALRAAVPPITRDTPDPRGGVIDRDVAGEPTGILRERAQDLLTGGIGFEVDAVSENELLTAIQTAHQLGLTGVHNIEGAPALRAFQDLRAQGKLALRVVHMIPAASLEYAASVGLQTGLGDEWLRLGGVKIFADGSLGSQTALMLEPFEGTRGHCGVPVTPKDEMERLARRAAQSKLMVCIHAIGDRANRDALDIFEKLRGEGFTSLFRIEHVQHLHPADLPRFHALNVIAAMQPIHATSDYVMADKLIGARGRWAYAFKSLLNAGATLAFGSDCPVETIDPLLGIHAAVTRERASGEPRGGWYPEEKLSVEEAVRGYTVGAARAAGNRAEEGMLTVGSRADCVALSQNIFEIPPREILQARVEWTVAGGQVVHKA